MHFTPALTWMYSNKNNLWWYHAAQSNHFRPKSIKAFDAQIESLHSTEPSRAELSSSVALLQHPCNKFTERHLISNSRSCWHFKTSSLLCYCRRLQADSPHNSLALYFCNISRVRMKLAEFGFNMTEYKRADSNGKTERKSHIQFWALSKHYFFSGSNKHFEIMKRCRKRNIWNKLIAVIYLGEWICWYFVGPYFFLSLAKEFLEKWIFITKYHSPFRTAMHTIRLTVRYFAITLSPVAQKPIS